MSRNTKITLVALFILIVVLPMGYWAYSMTQPAPYDELAACLTEKGVTFYGAFWCPHCAEQKRLFGRSAERLPYIECSTPDKQGQLQICIDAQIKGYPTWEFPGGERATQVLTPEVLAEKASCPFPN